MTAREVRKQFKLQWMQACRVNPDLKTDKPAKRYAFSVFVDDLARSGEISERVAQNVTLEG